MTFNFKENVSEVNLVNNCQGFINSIEGENETGLDSDTKY
jgi:hypothetical protein